VYQGTAVEMGLTVIFPTHLDGFAHLVQMGAQTDADALFKRFVVAVAWLVILRLKSQAFWRRVCETGTGRA